MNNEQVLRKNGELIGLCQNSEEEKLFNYFLKKIGSCQKCGTDEYVSYVILGDPTPQAAELKFRTGIIVFGGCSPVIPPVNQKCRKCGSEFNQ